MIPDFHNVALDNYLTPGANAEVTYKTSVIRLRSGHEERVSEWQDALRKFNITPIINTASDLATLLSFYRARNGVEFGFKFRDPTDYSVTLQQFGVGTGVQTVFQLIRRYATGISGDTYTTIRPVILPDSGVRVFFNGVEQLSGFTVDLDTGVVTFSTPPALAVVIAWTGTFRVPVRFLNQELPISIENFQSYTPRVELIEIRTPVPSYIMDDGQSADFIETEFPAEFAERSSMGPAARAVIDTSTAGQENRVVQLVEPQIRFNVSYSVRTSAQANTLMTFFHARRGRAVGFRVRDITDYQASNVLIGTGDGVTTQFQFVKIYTSGGFQQTRTIKKPVSGTVSIFLNGVLQSSGFTVDYTTGIVTFTTPPGLGIPVRWSGDFCVPVRFDTDTLTLEMPYPGDDVIQDLSDVNLVEIQTTLPAVTLVDSAPARFSRPSGCAVDPFPRRTRVTKSVEFNGTSGILGFSNQSFQRMLYGARSFTFACVVRNEVGCIFNSVGNHKNIPAVKFDFSQDGIQYATSICPRVYNNLIFSGTGRGLCNPEGSSYEFDFGYIPTSYDSYDTNEIHIYIITVDWGNGYVYASGSACGSAILSKIPATDYTCTKELVAGVLPRVELAGVYPNYLGLNANYNNNLPSPTFNYTSLGAGFTPNTASLSPSEGFTGHIYEFMVIELFLPAIPQMIVQEIHKPLMEFWRGLYGVGATRYAITSVPGSASWYRADEGITLDISSTYVDFWTAVNLPNALQPLPIIGNLSAPTVWPKSQTIAGLPPLNEDGLKLVTPPIRTILV